MELSNYQLPILKIAKLSDLSNNNDIDDKILMYKFIIKNQIYVFILVVVECLQLQWVKF